MAHPALLVWFALVLCCLLVRPLVLGFYGDDWAQIMQPARAGTAFSMERLVSTWHIKPSRVGMFPLWFLLSSLLGDLPPLWHLSLAAANVGLAGLLAVLATRLLRSAGKPSSAAWVLASSWLILPWNGALHFWPTLLPVVLTLAGTGTSALLFLRALDEPGWRGRWAAAASAVLYLWACTSYEAAYFQFLPFLLLGAATRYGRVAPRRLAFAAGLLVAAQGGAVGWYKYSQSFATANSVAPNFWPYVGQNVERVLPEILISTNETATAVQVLAIALLVVAGLAYRAAWRSAPGSEPRRLARTALLVVATGLLGSYLSFITFSFGVGVLTGVGLDARRFLVVSFWLVLAAILHGELIRAVWPHRRWPAWLALALALTLVGGHLARLQDWAKAWQLQQRFLAQFPYQALQSAPPGSQLLYVAPTSVNGAPVFSALWDINAALRTTYPSQDQYQAMVYNPWLGPMDWDGKQLIHPHYPEYRYPATRVYVWQPLRQRLTQLTGPIRIGQNFELIPITP